MSTSWTRREDQELIKWVNKGLKSGWSQEYLFISIGQKLKRTPKECLVRWQLIGEENKWKKTEKQIAKLEQLLQHQQKQIEKMSKDMRFYELMLLEEYHLLLKLLGEDQQKLRIHRI